MTIRYTDLMLDIETLGTTPDAPFLSLAAVPFAAGVVMPLPECHHWVIDLSAELSAGAVAGRRPWRSGSDSVRRHGRC